jgi:hypothetical protein
MKKPVILKYNNKKEMSKKEMKPKFEMNEVIEPLETVEIEKISETPKERKNPFIEKIDSHVLPIIIARKNPFADTV